MPAVHKQSHVSLLQEDLLRLPSFPRTAIDAEFSLFNEPQGEKKTNSLINVSIAPTVYFRIMNPALLCLPGKELFGLDTLHKVLWIKLLEEMFLGMPSEYPWGDEMMLFLNVFNGALLLHPEDSSLLRQYTATAINTAVHFNHLFSLSGYQWMLPTMLQVRLPVHTKLSLDSEWRKNSWLRIPISQQFTFPIPSPCSAVKGLCRLREQPSSEARH